ncbi:MAG: sensor histidine kinase [Deltaproteobacteria bacterium]|nr:sensor histidine kinase [Deltaproteobacteria bacterium]
MKFYRPKSFLILLLAGFIFVAFPLLAALASSAYFMEKITTQSTQAVFWAADSARESRSLLELLVEQERQARIYNIFAEPEHLAEIENKHEKIGEILITLAAFPFADSVKDSIGKLRSLEAELFPLITSTSKGKERKEALDQYIELNMLAQEIKEASYSLMFQETANLQKSAFRYQKRMFWLTCILFFVSLILISIFAFLLVRPIRQIDKSIIRLGEGDFVTPVAVSGPRDLEFLGTKLDWLRERLAELEKDKNKFVAHISHELKTPLASIREGSGLLGEEVVGPLTSQQKEVVKILTNNSRLLQTLIENIVNFNMAQARHHPPNKERFSLDQLIAEVVESHKPVLLANDLHVIRHLAPTPIRGDRDQIRTIIDNIVSNAIKHSPNESDITITLKNDSDKAIIDIMDCGPGIPAEERSKIFRPFFQGKNGQKGRVKGTGLGLAIASEYMANHHGTVEAMPDNGQGAHFRLTFPMEKIS